MSNSTVYQLRCHECKTAWVELTKYELEDHGRPYCNECLRKASEEAARARELAQRKGAA